jgi:hypothetical protein
VTRYFDVEVQQVRAASAGSGRPLEADELTILTGWDEAVVESSPMLCRTLKTSSRQFERLATPIFRCRCSAAAAVRRHRDRPEGMNGVVVGSDHRTARMLGGARASDVVAVGDPLGVVPVAGSVGVVGMAGLTLGGGYGPLIGRFGLALDNLLAADLVLADGRFVIATHDKEEELLWALRGGGETLAS